MAACANALNSLNFWWSPKRSCLCIVIFPEPLYCRTLAQPFKAAIEVVPYIAKWLMKPFADLSQFHPFEIEHLQCLSLHRRQVLKGTLQVGEVESYADFAFHIALPH